MQEYGGKVPHTDLVSLDDLKEAMQAYNRSMAEAQAFVEERKPGMVAMLERGIKEAFERVQVRNGWAERVEERRKAFC
jgi:hypothetical protein